MKNIFLILFLTLGLAVAGVSITGCSAGARVGPVGAGASVG